MLYETQKNAQYANPSVINALTKTHGLYMNVYDKKESNIYDEGRDNYISNVNKFDEEPRYKKIKLLLNRPVQESFDSGEESFDSYINDLYIITCDKSLVFEKEQKFEVFYDKKAEVPVRVFQCFEVREFSNAYNKHSTRHIMLKSFT